MNALSFQTQSHIILQLSQVKTNFRNYSMSFYFCLC
jgi:hypothetical protein